MFGWKARRHEDPTSLDVSTFPQQDGIAIISPPQSFVGGEEEYDATVGGALVPDQLRSGRGAWELVAHHSRRPIKTLLEIGAGGGTCSLGLLDAADADTTLLFTDTSPAFLRIIRRKISAGGHPQDHIRLATLAGEDLAKLASDSVDAIVIASALHHVSDWRAFLDEAARVLRTGGVLAAQEPCREGNYMMGMMLDVALANGQAAALFDDEDTRKLSACRDSIYYLADTTVEKVGEDKHTFLVSDVVDAAGRSGFSTTRFYANRHFSDLFGTDLGETRTPSSIIEYLDSFLRDHHRISEDGLGVMRDAVYPIFKRLDARFVGGDGVPLLGCFALVK